MKDWRNWAILVLAALVVYQAGEKLYKQQGAYAMEQKPPMAKLVGIVDRPAGVSEEEFERWWYDVHAPIVMKMPGLRRYVWNRIKDPNSPHHGMAETWFDNLDAAKAAFASAAGQEAMRDANQHVGKLDVLIVEEHVLIP